VTYHANRIKHWIFFRSRWLVCHLMLYIAPFLPNSWIKNDILVNLQYLDKVKEKLNSDWEASKNFAQKFGA
jgi:hypothetical protein